MAEGNTHFAAVYIDPKLLSPSPNPSFTSPPITKANDNLDHSPLAVAEPAMQPPNDHFFGYEPDSFNSINFNNAAGSDFPSFVVENSASQTPESNADDAFPLTPSSDRTGGHSRPENLMSTPKSSQTRGRSLLSKTTPTVVEESNAEYNRLKKQQPTPQSGTGSASASGTTSGRSSEDSFSVSVQQSSVPTIQSPSFLFSLVGQDEDTDGASTKNPHLLDAYHTGPAPSIASDMATYHDDASAIYAPSRDVSQTREESSVRHRGIAPPDRSGQETESINRLARKRMIEERNQQVDSWLTIENSYDNPDSPAIAPKDYNPNEYFEEISVNLETENKEIPDQTYIKSRPEDMDQADVDIIRDRLPWESGPRFHPIEKPEKSQRLKPESSQAAIAMYAQRFMADNQSMVSIAATAGTYRRRSFPDPDELLDHENEVSSGSIFKKLSLKDKRGRSHGRSKSGVILQGIQGISNLIRSPSTGGSTKRARSRAPSESSPSQNTLTEAENSSFLPSLNIPGRSGSIKRPLGVTQIVASVGSSAAFIGPSHTRHGSVSAITSPKMNRFRRKNRSKSDAGRSGSPSLAGLLMQHGGMPGTNISLGSTRPPSEAMIGGNSGVAPSRRTDDTSDEDELDEEDMAGSISQEIEIEPNFDGFKDHIRKLTPEILPANEFLIARIAQQQVIRYKNLLNARKKHIQAGSLCNSGAMYCAHGQGGATLLDSKGNPSVTDASLHGEEENGFSQENTLTDKSFPEGIPIPPTRSLPAEFECRLCFQVKKFIKPSDWTKHVQEDIQPFTCTWDKCHDSKSFKRKADWVRHENEGHRHLEWWTCDVPECNHTCYRRDNFLQHLVREHKCAEPKTKAKGQSKRDAPVDPTAERVAHCHHNTDKKPESEPCRFCGKRFSSWKKLTVHMAKHMEKISFPVIALAEKAYIDEDTIISPVQDQPPRPFSALTQEEINATFRTTEFPMPTENASYMAHHLNIPHLNIPQFPFPVNNVNSQFPTGTQPVNMGYGQGGMSSSPLTTNLTPSTLSINTMSPPNRMFAVGQQTTPHITPQMAMQSSPAQHMMHNMNATPPLPNYGQTLVQPQQFDTQTSMEDFNDTVVIQDSMNTGYMNNQPLYFGPINGLSSNMYTPNMQNPNANQFYEQM